MFVGASIMMLADEGKVSLDDPVTRFIPQLEKWMVVEEKDGAYGTDLSVNPQTGMVALFMVQCPGPDQWAARDLFLKTATQVFK